MSLITASEVVTGGLSRPNPADIRLDKSLVSPHLDDAEYRWVVDWLGKDFYTVLETEKGSFGTIVPTNRQLFPDSQTNILVMPASSGLSSTPNQDTNVAVFQNGKKLLTTTDYTISSLTITINVLTHFNGANYEVIIYGTALTTTTTVFTTPQYQALWDLHLKQLCGFAVMYEAAPYISMQAGTNGIYYMNNEHGENVKATGFTMYQDSLKQKIEVKQKRMKDWLCASAANIPYFQASAIGCPETDCGCDDTNLFSTTGIVIPDHKPKRTYQKDWWL